MNAPGSAPTPRTKVRRVAERGRYDAETVRGIVDEAWHCHVAFADEHGVHCIPMACWRHEDALYLHGSNGSRLLKSLAGGAQVCVTITHLDGLVLARSAFHHSMNYRSAVVYGRCERVSDEDKPAVLDHFLRRIAPGRELEARPGDRNELAATLVLAFPWPKLPPRFARVGRRTMRLIYPGPYGQAHCRCVWTSCPPCEMRRALSSRRTMFGIGEAYEVSHRP